jgi:hypothetical protein
LFFHQSALLGCRKLTETRIKSDSEFVSGDIVLGRFRFDSFALNGGGRLDGVDAKLATFQALTA